MMVTYLKKPNGKWDELTEFKNNIKTKHIQSAKVILDFKENDVILKCGQPSDKVYILASGEIEIYLPSLEQDMIIDFF